MRKSPRVCRNCGNNLEGLHANFKYCCQYCRVTYLRKNRTQEQIDGGNRRNRVYYYKTRRLQYREDPVKYVYGIAKKRAKKLGVEFTIEIEDIVWNEVCPITGDKLDVCTNSASSSVSLDRVDNSKGYVKGNVAVISRKGNRMKSDLTLADLKVIMNYIEEFSTHA